MKIYDVQVTKEITFSTTVRIRAEGPTEAKELAAEFVLDHLSEDEMDRNGTEIDTECPGPSEDQDREPDYGE